MFKFYKKIFIKNLFFLKYTINQNIFEKNQMLLILKFYKFNYLRF